MFLFLGSISSSIHRRPLCTCLSRTFLSALVYCSSVEKSSSARYCERILKALAVSVQALDCPTPPTPPWTTSRTTTRQRQTPTRPCLSGSGSTLTLPITPSTSLGSRTRVRLSIIRSYDASLKAMAMQYIKHMHFPQCKSV